MIDTLIQYVSLQPLTIAFALDVLVAVTFGYIIGAEREWRGKDAGISTHTFVICGAMLFTFMSMTVDPASKSRIAAQIVSGIGFLGAGIILKDGMTIRNLTTAASIWFAGAIGMAIGFGYHQIALVATAASVIIPRIPHIKKKQRAPETTPPTQSSRHDAEPVGAPTSDD